MKSFEKTKNEIRLEINCMRFVLLIIHHGMNNAVDLELNEQKQIQVELILRIDWQMNHRLS